MAAYDPPIKNVAWETAEMLADLASSGSFRVNPTIAAGDWKVDIDGAGFNNLATLPTVTPTGGRRVRIQLSAAEMNGDVITVQGVDQTSPKEWADIKITIQTTLAVQPANVTQLLGTALTEGAAGRLKAAFTTFFDIAAPVFTTASVNQTGDNFARVGANGAGLTALGDARIANLDAAVSSRMATYTQPTGFLAVTFPAGTVANTTNITAGTITTVTNLTNAPTAGDFTAAMKTSLNAATPAVTVSDKTGFSLTTGERTAIANEVEAQIIDETDSEKVLTAITDKIASVNPSLSGLTLAAIASAVRDVLNTGPAANSLGAMVKAAADRMPGSGTLATTADVPSAAANATAAAAAVTTDHGAGSYVRNTEPDNTGIGDIAAKAALMTFNGTALTVDVVKIAGSAEAATKQAAAARAIYVGTVEAGSTATKIVDSGLSGDANAFNGRVAIINGGPVQYQGSASSAFNATLHELTLNDTLTQAPTVGTEWVLT